MVKRGIFVLGVILFLLGCITSTYLGLRITNARIEGIFSTTASDAPTKQFKRFRSPLLLGRNETASIAVTILNPTSESLEYSVHIEARGLSIRSPETELKVSVPGGQTAKIAWVVTAIEIGDQTIAVQAVSDKDVALPGPFHMWPTSFRQGCGILVIDGPLTGRQVVLSSLTCVLIGAILSFPRLYAKLRKKQRERPN